MTLEPKHSDDAHRHRTTRSNLMARTINQRVGTVALQMNDSRPLAVLVPSRSGARSGEALNTPEGRVLP